jgi:hypothetical protein
MVLEMNQEAKVIHIYCKINHYGWNRARELVSGQAHGSLQFGELADLRRQRF